MLKTVNSFSLNLSIPNFNFSASSSKKETPSVATKKTKYKSPSQKKRDYLRKQIYLKQKLDVPKSKDSSEKSEVTEEKDTQKHVTHDRFKCEQCGEKLDNQNYITNHMISKHKEPGKIFSFDLPVLVVQVEVENSTSITSKGAKLVIRASTLQVV